MNPERGEVAIRLGGQEVVLRPTFEALVEVEQQLGQGLVTLARRMAGRDLGMRDAAVIVRATMAGDTKPGLSDVGRQILEAGLVTLIGPLTQLVTGALAGGSQQNPPVSPGQAGGPATGPIPLDRRTNGSPAGA